MTAAYVESSALAKLVVREQESDSLQAALQHHDRRFCSELGTIEVTRAAARAEGLPGLTRARRLRLLVDTIPIDGRIVDEAARLEPWSLRSLDAIHVATALALARDDVTFYSYDRRALDAARAAGLDVASPS